MNTEFTERQREIIQVSLELISESGIQSLTIKNLAKRIGFVESAIYRHYENKIQILMAILEFFKQNSSNFYDNHLSSPNSALVKIEKLFQHHFAKFSVTPSLVAVIFSEEIFRNEAELTEKVQEMMNHSTAILKTIIETGQTQGEIRTDVDAAHLSVIILGSLRLFVKKWHLSNYSFDLIEKGAALSNSVIKMIKS